MKIVIRDARSDDAKRAADVVVAAFEQYRSTLDSYDASAFERYIVEAHDVVASSLATADAHLFIAADAESGDRIVGSAALYPPPKSRHASQDHHHRDQHQSTAIARAVLPDGWAMFRLLAVDPAYRGRGIARMLIDARIARARALGVSAVALHTSTLFGASERLYQRLNWKREPTYDYHPMPNIRAEAYVLYLT